MKNLAFIYVLSFLAPDATHDVALYHDAVQCETARKAAIESSSWIADFLFCFPTINDGYKEPVEESDSYASLLGRLF